MTLNVMKLTPNQAYEFMKRIVTEDRPHPEFPDRKWRPTIMLHGKPGSGKSSLVRKLSRELFDELPRVVHAALIEATDLKGLCDLDRANRVTSWLKPEFLPRTGRGIIFFDEITQARRDVMAAVYPILLERQLDDWTCPEDFIIICAGNDVEDGAHGNSMGTALNDRLLHIEVVSAVESTIEHLASKEHSHPAVLALLRQSPQLLDENEERIKHDLTASPTPRAWEDVCVLANVFMPDMSVVRRDDPKSKMETLLAHAAFAGRVGKEAAGHLMATVEDITEGADVPHLMENYDRLKAEDFPKTMRGALGMSFAVAHLAKTEDTCKRAFHVLHGFREHCAKTGEVNVRESTTFAMEKVFQVLEAKKWLAAAQADTGRYGKAIDTYLQEVGERYVEGQKIA